MPHSKKHRIGSDWLIKKTLKYESSGTVLEIHHKNGLRGIAKRHCPGSKYLEVENEILSLLAGKTGFQKVHYYNVHRGSPVIILDHLLRNMNTVRLKCGGKLKTSDILYMGIQMLDRLEALHETGYIHGRVHGRAIRITKSQLEKQTTLFLVDFKHAKKYPLIIGETKNIREGCSSPFCNYIRQIPPTDGNQARRRDLEAMGFFLLTTYCGSDVFLSQDDATVFLPNLPREGEGFSMKTPKFLEEYTSMLASIHSFPSSAYGDLRGIFRRELERRTVHVDGEFNWQKFYTPERLSR